MPAINKSLEIIIAGAGIGGLAAALELHRVGVNARIYEAVEEIRPLGVGINLLPHGVKILAECGLLEELRACGVETADLAYFNQFGQKIWSEPRGVAAGYALPQFSIHRGELQMLLLRAVRARLGDDAVRTGRHLADFEQTADGRVRAHFVNRRDGASLGSDTADVLIGADGVHSRVRALTHPSEGPPKWEGGMLWRATTQATPFLSGRSHIVAGTPAHSFAAYPISNVRDARGMAMINWVAQIPVDPAIPFEREDWNRRGKPEDVIPFFKDWRFDWLDVPALMQGAEVVYEYPAVDRDPLDRWTFGRVTLLGDAAHPMTAKGSNGASQAILDARALADAFVACADIDQALAAYEAQRRPATTRVVLSNRQLGPAEVLAIAEKRAPNGFDDIERVIPRRELEAISSRYKLIAGFDRETVNDRAMALPD